MCRAMSVWVLLCGLVMMQAPVSQTRPEASVRKDIDLAFGSSKVVVLVISPAKSAGEESDSEAYGDWADYLHEFSSSVPSDTKIVKLTSAKYRQAVEEPKIRRDFATVFLKDATHALLYDGMVVEPKVYKLGLGWLHQHAEEKDLATYGLVQRPAQLK
jgi:hypothetical protein